VAITGNQTFNNWNWPNAMIFAATVITTIGKSLEAWQDTPFHVILPGTLTAISSGDCLVRVKSVLSFEFVRT
jgi:hypothetical protein